MPNPAKAIPPARDRLQSRLLLWTTAPFIVFSGLFVVVEAFLGIPRISNADILSISVSLAFGFVAWRMKAATPAAATFGAIICLLLTTPQGWPRTPLRTGLPPLIMLFALTHAATCAGRKRKTEIEPDDSKQGRNATQVIANLGIAVLLVFPFGAIAITAIWDPNAYYPDAGWVIPCLVLSALAEATADTVSSEIGKAFGGRPILITTFRRVDPGTDGAISLRGTLAGILAATLVTAVGTWSVRLSLQRASIALAAGVCGMLFDSLLGATLERKGWIGNNLVNFCSTAFSSAVCLIALRFIPGIGPHPHYFY